LKILIREKWEGKKSGRDLSFWIKETLKKKRSYFGTQIQVLIQKTLMMKLLSMLVLRKFIRMRETKGLALMFIFKDALSDHLRNLCSRWEEVKYSSHLLKRPIISRLKMRITYISGLIHSNLSLINQLISCSLELNKILKSYISKKPPIKN
jgi:hypothetical protein